ncbi:beta-galactosidase, partial [Reticulomyxa filosa]
MSSEIEKKSEENYRLMAIYLATTIQFFDSTGMVQNNCDIDLSQGCECIPVPIASKKLIKANGYSAHPQIPSNSFEYTADNLYWITPTTILHHAIAVLRKLVTKDDKLSPVHIIECSDTCECEKTKCQNRVSQKRTLSLYLEFDEHKHWSLFTSQPIANGQFVIEFVGEVLIKTEYKQRRDANPYLLIYRELSSQTNEVITEYFVDPFKYGNASRFINHSCDPNLTIQLVRYGCDLPHLCLFACKDIQKGDELTFLMGSLTLHKTSLHHIQKIKNHFLNFYETFKLFKKKLPLKGERSFKKKMWTSVSLLLGLLIWKFETICAYGAQLEDVVSTGDFLYLSALDGKPYNVTYDERSFIIDGKRTLLLGGSIHYPRVSMQQWDDILKKAREDGLNHVEVYVFWNLHEPTYDFSGNHVYLWNGRANLSLFLQKCQQNDLFVNLRIGHTFARFRRRKEGRFYADKKMTLSFSTDNNKKKKKNWEWDFGGLPVVWMCIKKKKKSNNNKTTTNNNNKKNIYIYVYVLKWLLHADGIVFRDNNQVWEEYMSTWMKEVANEVEPYLARHGGPIVLAQIENEYEGSEAYVEWCGQLAESLDLGIPWVMCNGMSANQTVNTCNGNNCWSYAQSHGLRYPGQPLAWTENEVKNIPKKSEGRLSRRCLSFEIGWFQYWNNSYDPTVPGWSNRSPEDMAYSVALWFGAGVHITITTCGTEGIICPILPALPFPIIMPMRSHLNRLHTILANHQKALLESPVQVGHEINLNPVNVSALQLPLHVSSCSGSQAWTYNPSNGLLALINATNNENENLCVQSTGDSNPVLTKACNASDITQKWDYSNLQFKFWSVCAH